MKTRECIEKLRTAKWIRIMALAIVAFIVFSYLHSRGISPETAAVAIDTIKGIYKIKKKKATQQKPTTKQNNKNNKGFFRFLYKIACLLVAAAILFCILSYLVF